MNKINLIIFHPYSGHGGADRSIARVINNLNDKLFNFYFISITNPKIKKFLNKKIYYIKIKSKRTIFSIFKIRKILKKKFSNHQNKNKNIFLSNQNFANVISFFILFNLKKFKHILIERNSLDELEIVRNPLDFFKKKIIKYLIQFLYKYSDLVICICKDLKKEIGNFTNAKTIAIYNPALDCSIHTIKSKLQKIKIKKNYILNIGRLEPQKDQLTLLKAYNNEEIKRKLNLIIIGYGSKFEVLKFFIKKNKLINHIKIIKGVHNAKYYLKYAKLFILSSKYEGFANVIIEAAQQKVPIISSKCNHGPNEILKKGKFGELFPVGDHYSLTNKILNFLNDDKFYKKKSLKLYKSLNRFSTKKIIKKYERTFLNI